MDCSEGRLTAEVEGDVETAEDGVLVIRRIRVAFRIAAPGDVRPTVERIHGVFAEKCPVYRSLRDAIEITTTFELAG